MIVAKQLCKVMTVAKQLCKVMIVAKQLCKVMIVAKQLCKVMIVAKQLCKVNLIFALFSYIDSARIVQPSLTVIPGKSVRNKPIQVEGVW